MEIIRDVIQFGILLIRTAMRKPKYKTAWKLLGLYYDDENFSHFMNNLTR